MNDRFKVNIVVEWEGLIGRRTGSIGDVSSTGCYVMCSGEVEDGETLKIFFPLSNGKKIPFLGEVVNHFTEIGFAVRFIELSEGQIQFLEKFVDTLRTD